MCKHNDASYTNMLLKSTKVDTKPLKQSESQEILPTNCHLVVVLLLLLQISAMVSLKRAVLLSQQFFETG